MKNKYSLYLASGITLWKEYFSKEYSKFFNRKVRLFEPGVLDNPDDHRKIPIGIACFDLNEINHADALLVYMKKYKTLDDSPTGTDSTWECGYAIGHGKPVIMLIENKEHIDYYASQWMVSFSINAILTADKEVAETIKNHPKFVHTTVLFTSNKDEFESKIIRYLDEYYRSIYSRSGLVNYRVDERARELFSEKEFKKNIFTSANTDESILALLDSLEEKKFASDQDSLLVCKVEREISEYLGNKITEEKMDSAIQSVLKVWSQKPEVVIKCLLHSVQPPFIKIKEHRHGVKKTRPELFFELYDLVTHHLVEDQRFIKIASFPYDLGAVIELYNWMNTYALDDVFDNSTHRQKSETVWKVFSRKDAVMTGILGHLLALKYAFIIARENKDIAKEIARIINDYNKVMYQGQVFDIAITFDSPEKKKLLRISNYAQILNFYVQRIYGICGGFFEAIGELAAKTGNKEKQIMNAEEVNKISPLVGMYYGLIQMIRNDLGDYILPSSHSKMSKGMKNISHGDIIEGKVNLPYLISLHSDLISKKEKDFLISSLYNKKLTDKNKMEINRILWKTGAVELTVEVIIHMINHVKKTILPKYHETPTRTKWMFNLIDITREILIPFKNEALKNRWEKYEFDPKVFEETISAIFNLEKTTSKGKRMPDLDSLLRSFLIR